MKTTPIKMNADAEQGSGDHGLAAKKPKMDDSATVFSNFSITKVLREDERHKGVNLQGEFKRQGKDPPQTAVILLQRKNFDVNTLERCLQSSMTSETLRNDIYSTHDVFPPKDFADVKATVICPATQKHIEKYSQQEPFVVYETPEQYETLTLPSIEQSNFSTQWVYNILEKKTESERIVVEDPDPNTGFVMVPDMKWDRKNMEALHLMTIVHTRNLKSIRDLRGKHVPLLKNVLEKGQKAIQDQFGMPSDKLRIYFHYQPSYYHLHIHFTHINFDAPGSDILRGHLIQDVIENLEMDSDFYKKKTLPFVVKDKDILYKKFKDGGFFS